MASPNKDQSPKRTKAADASGRVVSPKPKASTKASAKPTRKVAKAVPKKATSTKVRAAAKVPTEATAKTATVKTKAPVKTVTKAGKPVAATATTKAGKPIAATGTKTKSSSSTKTNPTAAKSTSTKTPAKSKSSSPPTPSIEATVPPAKAPVKKASPRTKAATRGAKASAKVKADIEVEVGQPAETASLSASISDSSLSDENTTGNSKSAKGAAKPKSQNLTPKTAATLPTAKKATSKTSSPHELGEVKQQQNEADQPKTKRAPIKSTLVRAIAKTDNQEPSATEGPEEDEKNKIVDLVSIDLAKRDSARRASSRVEVFTPGDESSARKSSAGQSSQDHPSGSASISLLKADTPLPIVETTLASAKPDKPVLTESASRRSVHSNKTLEQSSVSALLLQQSSNIYQLRADPIPHENEQHEGTLATEPAVTPIPSVRVVEETIDVDVTDSTVHPSAPISSAPGDTSDGAPEADTGAELSIAESEHLSEQSVESTSTAELVRQLEGQLQLATPVSTRRSWLVGAAVGLVLGLTIGTVLGSAIRAEETSAPVTPMYSAPASSSSESPVETTLPPSDQSVLDTVLPAQTTTPAPIEPPAPAPQAAEIPTSLPAVTPAPPVASPPPSTTAPRRAAPVTTVAPIAPPPPAPTGPALPSGSGLARQASSGGPVTLRP